MARPAGACWPCCWPSCWSCWPCCWPSRLRGAGSSCSAARWSSCSNRCLIRSTMLLPSMAMCRRLHRVLRSTLPGPLRATGAAVRRRPNDNGSRGHVTGTDAHQPDHVTPPFSVAARHGGSRDALGGKHVRCAVPADIPTIAGTERGWWAVSRCSRSPQPSAARDLRPGGGRPRLTLTKIQEPTLTDAASGDTG